MAGESAWTAGDTLIICGDFGFVWYDETSPELKRQGDLLLDMLAQKPYEILFVDGNHENFDLLYAYPEIERYGGTVHQIRKNIFHLQRGRIYTIENKTFFTFGGAYSIDKASRMGLPKAWWPQELPSGEEYDRGLATLKAVDFSVDYIVSHTAPNTALEMLRYTLPPRERDSFWLDPHDMELRSYLDMIWHNARFKRWYFGHWHIDCHLTEKARALLFDLERIE